VIDVDRILAASRRRRWNERYKVPPPSDSYLDRALARVDPKLSEKLAKEAILTAHEYRQHYGAQRKGLCAELASYSQSLFPEYWPPKARPEGRAWEALVENLAICSMIGGNRVSKDLCIYPFILDRIRIPLR